MHTRTRLTPPSADGRCVVRPVAAPAFLAYHLHPSQVTTSLLDLLSRDPDMLAVVLAHESAHVRARHSAERMSNATRTLPIWVIVAIG